MDASAELAAAKTAQADEHAPFEFVAAEEYLRKAREEQSYADFEVAVVYARKSRDCARVARMIAEATTREEMGSTRATHTTKARCRPGPERLIPIPDPAEEAASLKGRKLIKKKKAPAAPKGKTEDKTEKKAPEDKTEKRKPAVPKEPEEPKDPELPEGDAK